MEFRKRGPLAIPIFLLFLCAFPVQLGMTACCPPTCPPKCPPPCCPPTCPPTCPPPCPTTCPPPCCPPKCCDLCETGCMQSPINIEANSAQDTDLPLLTFQNHWVSDLLLNMAQAGRTIVLKPTKDCKMTIEGGPLSGTYILDQIHFHWGENDVNGTEHCIDDAKFAMEAHLVYYNCVYKCIEEAMGKMDGIAISAYIIESTTTHHNCFLDTITQGVAGLSCGECVVVKTNPIRMFREASESNEYFTYEGSLTTKPCSENVIWMIFKCKIKVHCTQVQPFRTVVDCCGKFICKNWRKPQPLNGRQVYNARATNCCEKRSLQRSSAFI